MYLANLLLTHQAGNVCFGQKSYLARLSERCQTGSCAIQFLSWLTFRLKSIFLCSVSDNLAHDSMILWFYLVYKGIKSIVKRNNGAWSQHRIWKVPNEEKKQSPMGIKGSAVPLPCYFFSKWDFIGFHRGKWGSGPNRGQSPVEWGDFLSAHSSVCLTVPLRAIHKPGCLGLWPD